MDLTPLAVRRDTEPVDAPRAGDEERRPVGPARLDPCDAAPGRARDAKAGGDRRERVQAARAGPESSAVAAPALVEWQRIEAVLAPVIGRRGVAAIYGRSLALTRRLFPWLPAPTTDATTGCIAHTPLHAALASRPDLESAAAEAALQQSFREVLASLVGAPLARRLLALRGGAGDGSRDDTQASA